MPFDEHREDGSGGDGRSHEWSDLHDYGDVSIQFLLGSADMREVCAPCAFTHMMGMLMAYMAWKMSHSRAEEPEKIDQILDNVREVAMTYYKASMD